MVRLLGLEDSHHGLLAIVASAPQQARATAQHRVGAIGRDQQISPQGPAAQAGPKACEFGFRQNGLGARKVGRACSNRGLTGRKQVRMRDHLRQGRLTDIGRKKIQSGGRRHLKDFHAHHGLGQRGEMRPHAKPLEQGHGGWCQGISTGLRMVSPLGCFGRAHPTRGETQSCKGEGTQGTQNAAAHHHGRGRGLCAVHHFRARQPMSRRACMPSKRI